MTGGNTSGGGAPDSASNILMDISLLIKLIPEFDGSFDKLTAFIDNVNSAHDLATPEQKPILMPFIRAALKGPAQNIVHSVNYTSWDNLKKKLISTYGEKKSFAQIQIELQNLKQYRDESVASFTQRIESKIQKLMSSLSFKNNGTLDTSQQELLKEMGLTAFIHNSLPQYGQLLRIRNPQNIVEASKLACDEEIALKFQRASLGYNTFNKNNSNKFRNSQKVFITEKIRCTFCNREGHKIENCFRKKTEMQFL